MLKTGVILVLCLLFGVVAASARKSRNATPAAPANKSAATYDAARDPAKDLQDAIALATKANKRILLEVGGDWCVYCNIMDETFARHPELQKARDVNYIYVRVNFSKENPNEAFLSHYPKIPDYPHFFVLDSKGTLVRSQPTHPFEHGKKYNAAKIHEFLQKWAQPPKPFLRSI
jgi:thiol:disulfide interchange protein